MEIKKNGNLALKLLFVTVLGVMVTSCGGGNPAGDSSSSASSGSGSGTNTGTDTTTTDTTRRLGSGVGSSFVEQQMDVSDGTLSAGGRTSVSVNFVNSSGELSTDSVSVTFNSPCVANGDATLSSATVTTTTGTATTNYTAAGCEGSDVITATATVGSQSLKATTTITVAPAEIGSVDFISSSTASIAFQGSGTSSRPSKSTLTFKVLDKNGNGVKGKTLAFTLSTQVGGITLSAATATTDSNGTATTTLNAGTETTTVRVIATYTPESGTPIYTSSDSININIGIADQNSFSMSIDNFNPNAYSIDGTEVNVTIHAADKNNNFVPDGTIINFVTSYGSIPGSCQTSNGACSVKWVSSGVRPHQEDVTNTSNRVMILARTVGEESFTDLNSNGKFDTNESGSVTQLSDAWLDVDDDGQKDNFEPYYDFDHNETFTAADTLYNGLSCTNGTKIENGVEVADSDDAVAVGHCASLVEVRTSHPLTMSSDDLTIDMGGTSDLDLFTDGDATMTVLIADEFGNCPPMGTTIDVSSTNGTFVIGESSYTVPNMSTCTSNPYSLTLKLTKDTTHSTGVLKIKATPPAPSTNKAITVSRKIID